MKWILIVTLALPMTVLADQAKEWNAKAEALMAQGSWDQARLTYLRLHSLLEKTLGPEDPQTVMALANACDASVQLASRIDAVPVCRRALELREKVLGPKSPETARSLSDLALLYSAEGDLNRAAKLLERALQIASADPASPDAAGLMNNLGYLYFQKGKQLRARELFEKALAVTKVRTDQVTILGNLGAAELSAHDARSAEQHFRQALAIAQASFGASDPKCLKALNGLSRAETALGNASEASEFQRKAQTIAELTSISKPSTR
jgi:tetratricopeptide (TPR) repeat protein